MPVARSRQAWLTDQPPVELHELPLPHLRKAFLWFLIDPTASLLSFRGLTGNSRSPRRHPTRSATRSAPTGLAAAVNAELDLA